MKELTKLTIDLKLALQMADEEEWEAIIHDHLARLYYGMEWDKVVGHEKDSFDW